MSSKLLPSAYWWILLALFQCASSSSFLLVAIQHGSCKARKRRLSSLNRLPLIDVTRRTEASREFHALRANEEGLRRDRYNHRRMFLLLASVIPAALTIGSAPSRALAADGKAQQDPSAATVWLSGKPPRIPGSKPKDKNDVSGTRKDPSFLRSIADCKNQCENVAGPDGLSKSKEECLSECQDICCTTYEQCTFAIVPRI
jgi:hypothetical protein